MKIIPIPFFGHTIAAGFPSPADDFIESYLDLNEYLIRHPSATYMAKAQGQSMVGRGIYDGDTLIVDRHIEAQHGSIVIAALDGELTCKILDTRRRLLVPAHGNMAPIPVGDDAELIIEGVVTHSIRHHVRIG
ncbi:translesion error-prone DNA polymerase V autoproteolytic subunit [Oceanicoccus sp. KOV_DT_Chl]|uniref:translesion error-prone DNA polymerase V autoproteolytic subunit n=1 Tax=Oceanicoccus sp. KOV_DT_Chl TaxID=1904639 RepID=UPI000C79DA46|nr:translesion error-prone DNA polymerase V autoproteolytic subunit [Oceanicoccus sp. KOV_DT_Chl]